MLWILFALGAALSWGLYGPALHRGQVELGNPNARAALRRRRLLFNRRSGSR